MFPESVELGLYHNFMKEALSTQDTTRCLSTCWLDNKTIPELSHVHVLSCNLHLVDLGLTSSFRECEKRRTARQKYKVL
jgi:hypothetical protein